MSAAILRRARHVPVTQCLARRWQTNTAQPQSYEEMLSGLEAEFPDPNKAPSKSKSKDTTERPQSPRKPVQPAANTHGLPDTPSLPVLESLGNHPRNTGESTRSNHTPHWKKTPRNSHASDRAPAPRQPSLYNKEAPRPRRIPPPTFKPSSEPHTKQDVPEQPVIRRIWHSSAKPEQSQALDQADVSQAQSKLAKEQFDFLEEQSKPELPPNPAVTRHSNPKANNLVSKSVEPSKLRPKPAKVSQKHVTSVNHPTGELHDSKLTDTPLDPLETTLITLAGQTKKPYDNIFLRDSCACHQCVDPSTRQKNFDSADIPTNIRVRSLDYEGDDVVISWKHDVSGYGLDHQTRLSLRWLRRTVRKPATTAYTRGKWAWTTAFLESKMVDFEYNDYMSDDKVLFELLRQLHVFGLAFIKNVPESESSVVKTANRIGPLKNTFYGDTWDVRSVSEAKNVAYTDVHLGFHMDLLYMQQPPRLQLLHCLRASTQGGVSLFSDSYQAADQLNKMDHNAFQALVETPVNFHYDNDNHHYFRSRRTFQLRDDASKHSEIAPDQDRIWHNLEAVNWAPPFQAPFSTSGGHLKLAKNVRAWHEAAQLFRDLTEMKSAVYKRQMAPGECVIFDNRRVLHARTAFAGGERWLRGAYLDDDPYLSKIRVLERTYGDINSAYISYLKNQ